MGSSTIQELWLSCKRFADDALQDWGVIALVIFVGLASFGLGRLSATEEVKSPVSVRQIAQTASLGGMVIGGYVIASKTGSVYYFPWCGSVGTITAEKQVWFKSEDAAKKAGYRPAKNCKGLE